MKKFIYKMGAAITTASALIPMAASAQLSDAQTQLGQVGSALGQESATPLPQLIGNLINAFLGVLGIIFVILVVYAGFLYMTAAGDDSKVSKAKSLLTQAIIGLVIIVAAYAIANFVIGILVGAVA